MEDAMEIRVGGQSGLPDMGAGRGRYGLALGIFFLCLTPFPQLGISAFERSFSRARLDSLDS